jgi:hypothetical protein
MGFAISYSQPNLNQISFYLDFKSHVHLLRNSDIWAGMVVHPCNPSTQEAEPEEF